MRLPGDLVIVIRLFLVAFPKESLSGFVGHPDAIPLTGSVVVPNRAEMDATVLIFQLEIPDLGRFVIAATEIGVLGREPKDPIDLRPLDVRDFADLRMAPEVRDRLDLIAFCDYHNATILIGPRSEIKSKKLIQIQDFACALQKICRER